MAAQWAPAQNGARSTTSALPGSGTEPGLREYAASLWRRKWIVVGVAGIVVGAALGYSYHQKPKYTAKADVLLQSPGSALLSAQATPLTPADVATQIQIITSAPVQAAVGKSLHSPAPKVSVSEVGQTSVVEIAATAATGRRAARIANAYANAYVSFQQQKAVGSLLSAATVIQNRINVLQSQIAATHGPGAAAAATALSSQVATYQAQLDQLQLNAQMAAGSAEVVTPATTPSTPSSPKPARTGGLAGGVGLLLGVGLALLVDALDDSIKSKDDLELAGGGIPVVGVIPTAKQRRRRKRGVAVAGTHPTSHGAESYRQLRTSLQFISLDHPREVMQVTSPLAAEGKTTTAVNLAVVFAQSGRRVALVDADLRRPRIHEYFSLDPSIGLTSVLLGETELSQALAVVEDMPELSVLASGPIPPNPAEVLASAAMGDLVSRISNEFDAVVIDGPPVLPVADATALATHADATLLVVLAGTTTTKAVRRSLELLGQVDARLTGLVMNSVPVRWRSGNGYGGYYGGRYGYTPRPSEQRLGNRNGSTKTKTLQAR